jgi:uncharacterized damage-inducible protein DinB
MKELLLRYLRYNIWANAQFIQILRGLSEEQLDQEIQSSFPSIRKTVNHMWGAEDIWLQRLQRAENQVWRVPDFNGDIQEACDIWEEASRGLLQFAVDIPDEDGLMDTIHVVNIKGEHYDDVICDVLQHVANHATYHRGQLVTMFRQAGVSTIPGTDYTIYVRGLLEKV